LSLTPAAASQQGKSGIARLARIGGVIALLVAATYMVRLALD